MTTYDTTLLGSEEVADATMAFRFEKPDGFRFKPGQSIDIGLPENLPGVQKDRQRTFSLVSAPHENELIVATRMRNSEFKRALRNAPVNTKIQIKGPSGSFTLHNNPDREAVMIAGGIGITPFISILRHQAHIGEPRKLLLLYSNRNPEGAAFLQELEQLAKDLNGFRLVATMTDAAEANTSWQGETRRIDASVILEECRDYSSPVYYVVGPPDMAEGLRNALSEAGVDDDDIRSEDFFGY